MEKTDKDLVEEMEISARIGLCLVNAQSVSARNQPGSTLNQSLSRLKIGAREGVTPVA